MKTLEEYSAENGLIVNVDKKKGMKFGTGGLPTSGDIFKIHDQQIEMVDRFCYLGFEFTRR